jgi:hypothetical protein
MLHSDSIGLIFPSNSSRGSEVLDHLYSLGMRVSGVVDKNISKWDYIVITKDKVSFKALLRAVSMLNFGGVIILEITGKSKQYSDKYLSSIGNLKITKVFYQDRRYLVLHTGDEYGN